MYCKTREGRKGKGFPGGKSLLEKGSWCGNGVWAAEEPSLATFRLWLGTIASTTHGFLANAPSGHKIAKIYTLRKSSLAVRIETITLLLPRWSSKHREITLEVQGVSAEASSRMFPEVSQKTQ